MTTSPPISTADRDKAKELCETATAGPWDIYRQPVNSTDHAIHELAQQVNDTKAFVGTLFLLSAMVGERSLCPATSGCGPTSEANAEFIAFARTAIPAYEARVVELEAALQAAEAKFNAAWEEKEAFRNLSTEADQRTFASEARATALLEALREAAPQVFLEEKTGDFPPLPDNAEVYLSTPILAGKLRAIRALAVQQDNGEANDQD